LNEAGIAAFAVDRTGGGWLEVQPAPRLRAASVLEPLLCWVGAAAEPFRADHMSRAAIAWRIGDGELARAYAALATDAGPVAVQVRATLGAAVTTAWPPNPVGRAATTTAEQIVAAHEALAGPTLRAGIRRGLRAAGCPGPPPS